MNKHISNVKKASYVGMVILLTGIPLVVSLIVLIGDKNFYIAVLDFFALTVVIATGLVPISLTVRKISAIIILIKGLVRRKSTSSDVIVEQEEIFRFYNKHPFFSDNLKKYDLINERKQFELWFFNVKSPMGHLILGKPEKTSDGQQRNVGAIAYLNGDQVLKNEDKVKNKDFVRSDMKRGKAVVPGFDKLSRRDRQVVNGEEVYLWHRTHLLPFKHTFSEGNDIEFLLFSGTAHLNSGDRPQLNYYVKDGARSNDSRDRRKKQLIDKFSCKYPLKNYQTAHSVFVENKKTIREALYSDVVNKNPINVKGAPEGSNYSLREVEEAVDLIILKHLNKEYGYGVFCNYENDESVVPESVSAYLINFTDSTIDFYIQIPNVF